MHTYFERIPAEQRFTSMSDENDNELLEFWKASWQAAGWEPVVLGLDDAKRHPRYDQYELDLNSLRLDHFAMITFRRYLAMATTGGWMCEYDAFPLRDFRSQGLGALPYEGKFALYNIVSATLAVADADNWEATLRALLDDAKQHVNKNQNQRNHWTDTLGVYSLLRNSTVHVKTHRLVMPASLLMVPRPWPSDFCTKRQLRKPFLVVHFDPQTMLLWPDSGDKGLSQFRTEIASEIMSHYSNDCGVNVMDAVG
ncbi:hypothetical protein MHU86_17590 [Fragilaria crotonensis]|nr:hypothetical protein MHU86_17590 [Fragilaria crotonensis]